MTSYELLLILRQVFPPVLPLPHRRLTACILSVVISSTAIFASSDIVATLAFYKDVLGFESTWTWGEPPTFGSVSMGGVSIMFNLQPELAAKVRSKWPDLFR